MENEEILKWQRRFERERASRKEAEKLLEDKSAELYELNQSLEKKSTELAFLNKDLKQKIAYEVEKNAQKERILFQQSKLASMGEMISNIAHQWRQPLQAIGILTQKLQLTQMLEDNLSKDLVDETVDKVNFQLNYLTNTIEDFRSFFIPNKEKHNFYLQNSFKKVLNLLESNIKRDEISLELELEDINIYSLENEFVQVLINIIKNAIDILKEKNIEDKTIKIISTKDENFICLEIMDNALGVPKEIQDKIFEPYFTTKHQAQGTGLGLYMSHEIIVKHLQGKLSVENIEFENNNKSYFGACFKIEIPYT